MNLTVHICIAKLMFDLIGHGKIGFFTTIGTNSQHSELAPMSKNNIILVKRKFIKISLVLCFVFLGLLLDEHSSLSLTFHAYVHELKFDHFFIFILFL